jgi:capsular exopolysaccharide synthesis family protein
MNENHEERVVELEKVDVLSFVNDFFHRFKRMWWIVVVLAVLGGLAMYYRASVNYSPSYRAEATASVALTYSTSSANRNTAEQMGRVFPYILTSGALKDVIAADLGVKSVPGTISVSNISGTNLLTISVTSSDPQSAYDVLRSVIRNYPEVAQYVVGQTTLTVIDDTGVPTDTGKETVVRGSLRRGIILGALLGIFIIMIYAATFRTVRTEKDLRALINVPCLGTLPIVTKRRRSKNTANEEINILTNANRQDYIEAMRLIRTRLERQMEGKKVLMVTSSISGEGKSTVAANLAISMALKGKKVILVDCDLRNPTTHEIFNIQEKFPGLIPVLQGKAKLRDALYTVTDQNGEPIGLRLLPGGERNSKLVEILGSESMKKLIEVLSDNADIVILDTPPSAVLVDAMMLVQYVDSVAYVVMSDFARRRYIYEGVEELTASDAPFAGCILNGGKLHQGSGYYGYSKSRYGYGFGSYGSYGTSGSSVSKS